MNANLLNPRRSVVLLAGIHPFLSPETARLGHPAMEASTFTASPSAPALHGARQVANAIGPALRRAGLAVWHTLELAGQRRAERELGLLATRLEHTHPETAAHLRAQLAQWRQG